MQAPGAMKGSTLYRKLPDGTWTAHREDEAPDTPDPLDPGPAEPGALGAGSAVADPFDAVSRPVGPGPSQARAQAHLAAEVAAVMAGSQAAAAVQGDTPGGARAGEPVLHSDAELVPVPPAPLPASVPPVDVAPPVPGPARAARSARKPSGPRPTKGKRRRPRWKKILLAAVAAYLAWIVFLLIYAAFSLHKVPAAAPVPNAGTPGTVWLMVGSDSREGLTAKERKELTTGGDFGQRTDTIMLLHMSGLGAPTLVSIPRDSWLTIPEYRTSSGRIIPAHQAKVNAAFAEGGAPLLNQTLQDATGLHIDHYAEVGFGGIVSLTNAVGGIDVCVDSDINDVKSGLKLTAGCHTLNGKQALAYVRMRYSDPKGDLGRIERQQEFVSKVMGSVLSWQTLVFPWRQWGIVNSAVDAVAVDDQANLANVARLGLGLGQVAAGTGEVTTVPTTDANHWAGGQWVLRWDEAAAKQLWQSMGAP